MSYESSYESGRKPFAPDLSRGQWDVQSDFIYAGIGLALKFYSFTTLSIFFNEVGIMVIIEYLLCLATFVVPLMILQTFLGQFSSSGFISVLRISPLFKGIGYVCLALNFCVLACYSFLVTLPIFFLINSFRSTLPWSCQGLESLKDRLRPKDQYNLCNLTANHSQDAELLIHESASPQIPSVLFFRYQFKDIDLYNDVEMDISLSMGMFICNIFTWLIIGGVFYKYSNTEKIGKFIRYAIWGIIVTLVIFLIRAACLPGIFDDLNKQLSRIDGIFPIFFTPLYAMSAFGLGWGSIMTLASFNKFKTNIVRSSWIICLGQLVAYIGFDFLLVLLMAHYEPFLEQSESFQFFDGQHWIHLISGSVFTMFEFSNMWCILYYGMLTIAGLIVMITQFHCFLISIFDEFQELRECKTKIMIIFVGFLAFFSFYFCTNLGVMTFPVLYGDFLLTQFLLNLLLIFVVLWVYGRVRFQRDIQFMLNQPFSTWKVNMLRFWAPLCIIFAWLLSLISVIMQHQFVLFTSLFITNCFLIIPWLCILSYSAFILVQTTGSLKTRLQRTIRPNDWYPVEAEYRQQYEESTGNNDITYQLSEMVDAVY